MFDLVKNQWIGIVAIVAVVAFLLVPTSALIDEKAVSEVTTITNPFVFEGTVKVQDDFNYEEDTEAVVVSNTLSVVESGLTSYLGTGGTTTLPAVATATGTIFRFVVAGSLTASTSIVSAEGDNIEGSLIVAGAVVDCDAVDEIRFVQDGENLGDFVELRSDGIKWFVTQSNALTSAKLTCSG